MRPGRLRPVERGFFPLFRAAGTNILAATGDLAWLVAADPERGRSWPDAGRIVL